MSKWSREAKKTVDGYTFSPGELEWARDNLDKMRRTVSNNSLLYLTMALTFVIGLVLYLLSDSIATGAIILPTSWRADLIADVLYNLGSVLWTSVVLVLFLEVIVEYQRRRWQRYLRLVEQALKGEQSNRSSTDEQTDAAASSILGKLDAILGKLDTIDQLQAEVAALKAEMAARRTSSET